MARRTVRQDRTIAAPPDGAGAAHLHAVAQAADPGNHHEWSPGVRGLVERARAVVEWWQHTRVARANARFGAAGGGLLTGGIAYSTLFSVFAGLAIGYTAFMAVLGGNAELRSTVLRTIDSSFPGLVDDGSGNGLIKPDQLVLSPALGAAGVVAVGVLLFSAISAVAALRKAVRAMFDAHDVSSAVLGKLRELGAFVGIAVAMLLSAVLGIVTTSAADWVLGVFGWSDSSGLVLQGLGILVAFVVDAGVFVLIVRVLADQDPPRRDLLGGAAIAAAGLGVVRLLGTSVVAGTVSRNPVLASFAAIVVLLLWINLIARIVLMAAAWTADPPQPAGAEHPESAPGTA